MSTSRMKKICKFSLDDVLPNVRQCVEGKKSYFWYVTAPDQAYHVKLSGHRLRLHTRQQACVCCKLQGQYYWLEKDAYLLRPGGEHMNLYGVKDGKEILLTADHILPKSKGGTNDDNNLQLLCEPCNVFKSDRIVGVEQLRTLRLNPLPRLEPRLGDWVTFRESRVVVAGHFYRPDTFGLVVKVTSKHAHLWLYCRCLTTRSQGFVSMNTQYIRHPSDEELFALQNTHCACPDHHAFLKGDNLKKCQDYLIGQKTDYLPFPIQVAMAKAGEYRV